MRRRQRPIELLFNLEHPDKLGSVTEVNENDDDDDLRRLHAEAGAVTTLDEGVPKVFKTDSNAAFLKRSEVPLSG